MKNVSILVIALGLLSAGFAYSHTGATGIVKERMDAMKDMGDQSKHVANMFKGKVEFDRHIIADAATAFAKHGSSMAELFPDTAESRTGGKTEALPRIWDDWNSFNEKIVEFITLSEALETTVASTEDKGELRKAFFRTTKSCSGCHKLYRQPKK